MKARRGYCFISPDPLEEYAGKFGLILAPTISKGGRSLQIVPKTGLVVHHNVTREWERQGEESLEGKRVVFDRWGGTPFPVVYDGKEYEFISISQWGILAVLEDKGEE